MSYAVGIDLGTTYTVVACVKDGEAQALENEAGEYLIPSVVSFLPSGEVQVGHAAKQRRLLDPKSTIYSIKRLIGRAWNSADVQEACKRFPFELREGPGQGSLVVARGESYTLPEISAYVLRKALATATQALQGPVTRAVITVPANFNDLQRAATKVAGRVAGLDVVQILNEPTAAALAYGYGRGTDERIAIFDFGGGTFDITILNLSGNVFEVIATAGNTFLGGDDLDWSISERMAEAFLRQHRYDPHTDPTAMERLRIAAETLKIKLSSQSNGFIEVADVATGAGGRAMHFAYSMARHELNLLVDPMLDSAFEVCERALSAANLTPTLLDQVILVGGTTRIPRVRERVTDYFSRVPLDSVHAEEVVALGAAIQAMNITDSVAPSYLEDKSEESLPATSVLAGNQRASLDFPLLSRASTQRSMGDPISESPYTMHVDLPNVVTRNPAQISAAPTLEPLRIPTPPIPFHSPHAPDPLPPPSSAFGLPSLPALSPLSSVPPPLRRSSPNVAALLASPSIAPLLDPSRGRGEGSSAAGNPNSFLPFAPIDTSHSRPVLLDVTPLSLCVETVGGYCDVLVAKNTPVPCEQTRIFVTAQTNQTTVRVRVAQGESKYFEDNTHLGEVHLVGLPQALRGEVTIAVTFSIDAEGIIHVRAYDPSTGNEAQARLQLIGLSTEQEANHLRSRQELQTLV